MQRQARNGSHLDALLFTSANAVRQANAILKHTHHQMSSGKIFVYSILDCQFCSTESKRLANKNVAFKSLFYKLLPASRMEAKSRPFNRLGLRSGCKAEHCSRFMSVCQRTESSLRRCEVHSEPLQTQQTLKREPQRDANKQKSLDCQTIDR